MSIQFQRICRAALSLVPNLVVLAILAGLAVGGYLTEWKIGKMSELWKPAGSKGEPADKADDSDKKPPAGYSPIKFASAEAVKKSGIETTNVEKALLSEFVTASGTIDYNRTRVAYLSTRSPGHVWKVYKHVGDAVHKGDILGLVDAADVGRAKGEFLQAVRLFELKTKDLEQQRRLSDAVLLDRHFRETEAAAADARIRMFNAQQNLANLGLAIRADEVAGLSDEELSRRLRFLGLPESLTRTFEPATNTANLLPLVVPLDGLVTRADAVEGEMIGSSQPQFVVADVRRLWVTLDVHQEDISRVRKELKVTFWPDGAAGIEAAGNVSWISTEVEDKTRTVRVRAEVDNAAGQLRARTFGTGRILISQKVAAATVPADAVQWDGASPLLFVRRGDGLSFEPRKVRLGGREGKVTEVLEGVLPGETVATIGSHVLRSELFRNEIGAAD